MTAAVFLGAFAAILRGLAPAFTGDDSGELAATIPFLGIIHPPGYPVFTMLGRLAMELPLGCPAFRVNLLSAFAGAGTVAMVYSVSRALLARLGRISETAPLVSAFLALTIPPLFHQSTQAEKYAFHALLALVVVRAYLSAERHPYRLAFAFGLSLSHHPMTIFLAPLLWPLRHLRGDLPSLLIACTLAILPLSTKALFPALRASPHALAASPEVFPWGEPARAGNLAGYLATRQYSGRFGNADGSFASRLAPQVALYPGRMTLPVMAGAAAGSVVLGLAAPAVVGPILIAIPLHWLLAGGFQLDLHLTPQYHLVPQLLLAVLAGTAVPFLPCLFGTALLAGLLFGGMDAGLRSLPLDAKDRDFAAWDYNRALLALAPRGSVLLAGMDNDLFPLRYLAQVDRARPDVAVLNSPFFSPFPSSPGIPLGAPAGLFERSAPDLGPHESYRRLLRSPAPRCIVLSGFNEPLLPGELAFSGPLAFPLARPCAETGSPSAWTRLPMRGLFDPRAELPRQRAILGVYEVALSIETQRALAGGRMAEAVRLSSIKRGLFPGAVSTWLEAGNLALARRDAASARSAFLRALDLGPGLVDSYAPALFLLEAGGDTAGLLALLERAWLNLPGLDKTDVKDARAAIEAGNAAEGARIFRGALHTLALSLGDREAKAGPTHLRRAVALYSLALRLTPDSMEARQRLDSLNR